MKKILCGFNIWPDRPEPLYAPIWAIVDDEDYKRFSEFNWHLSGRASNNGSKYVSRNIYSPELYGKDKMSRYLRQQRMHHDVIGKPPAGKVVHHINGNPLDNRRSNLMITTQRYNIMSNSRWNPIVKNKNRYQLRISFPTLEEAEEALRRHLEDYPD